MSKKSSYYSSAGHSGSSSYYPATPASSSDVPRKHDTGMLHMNSVIPRIPKKKPKVDSSLPWVSSESPQFVIRIPTSAISYPRAKRVVKKRSYNYEDLDNFDDDLQDTDDESPKSKKKVQNKSAGSSSKRLKKSSSPITEDTANVQQPPVPVQPDASSSYVTAVSMIDPNSTESPPAGILNSLWYSRECVLHIWVVEKVLGWRRRPVTKLQYDDDDEEEEHVDPLTMTDQLPNNDPIKKMKKRLQDDGHLDQNIALTYHDHVVALTIKHSNIRHEVSRINASACPMVLRYAAEKEKLSCKNEKPKFQLASSSQETEEVYFVKWRGRSYIHCSWERKKDLEKFDTQAKVKLKRYHQHQEQVLGKQWKLHYLQLQSQSSTSSSGIGNTTNDLNTSNMTTEEDYFSSDHVEPERVLACDETELDLKVLAKQRALNLRAEREAFEKREHESPTEEQLLLFKHADQFETILKNNEKSIMNYVEDPEDNVRYVVKWKGQPFAEVTWEYWRDIKYDAVDEVEDFWYRQKPPALEPAIAHPHMRDYKKLTQSPIFGISTKERPIANLSPDKIKDKPNASIEEPESNPALALKLRAYQLEGVNWLLWNWWNKRSCILADEMGLGKTIQTMCFLDQLHRLPSTKVRGPFLIVAPLSLVNQWQSESKTWAPDMNVVLYHGSADARDYLVQQEFYYTDQFVHPKSLVPKYKRYGITKLHILITTYEVILKDIAVLSKIKWRALIVDEAHRLKNNKSRLFVDLGSVPREFCLLLTGTPLQNSTEELWALLHFSDPKMFASKEEFVEKFGQLTDSRQVSDLHAVLKPYLLRRVKEDVEKSLPPKEETILEVTLTPVQKTYYKAIYEKNTTFLFKGAKSGNAPSLMNVMMELRKCCNHPFLIKGAEERIMIDAAAQEKKKNPEQEEQQDMQQVLYRRFAQQLVKSSGKMVLLEKLMPKLQAGRHKVLIFSQMVRVLDLLEEFLRLKHYKYERLDGSTGSSSRAAAVDRFNRKSFDRFVMLLSTRAGGLGLNLTSADTVIIFDSDWNPQNDLQAMARAHRIGQTRAVSVYRLLTNKTYEMHMFHSASMKLGLDRAVLAHQRQQESDAGNVDEGNGKKSKSKSDKEIQAKEIDELLKKGAYDVFRDDDDAEAQKFMETDIDQLLERSARKVTYGNTDKGISSGLGSFSKASFVTADADGNDVDLDDPDFWAKAVGLEAPTDLNIDENLLLDGEKRSRKQVQVFDPYAAYAEAEQKKKDKIAQKEKEEKEEKERLKSLKKNKKKDKDKKKTIKDKSSDSKQKSLGILSTNKKGSDSDRNKKKKDKNSKSKKARKAERRRAVRKAAHENPVIEQIKQGWEATQRNRAISAILLFGFGRFCKIRNESNLTSLPIQDLEVFFRSYVYILGLHSTVTFLATIYNKFSASSQSEIEISGLCENYCFNMIDELDSHFRNQDQRWVLGAMKAALLLHSEIRNRKRTLRIPLSLSDPDFVSELRSGVAFGALYRLAFLARFNILIEGALDKVLEGLGNEELGKRGCPTKDLSTLDIDLKARHVTSEELCYALGEQLSSCMSGYIVEYSPALWWDRSCDLALLVGTFNHGLGRYKAIFKDSELPFEKKIKNFLKESPRGAVSFQNFHVATKVVLDVYQQLLSSLESKKNVLMEGTSTEKNKCGGKETPSSENNPTSKSDAKEDSIHENHFNTMDLPSLSAYIQRDIKEISRKNHNCTNKTDDTSNILVMPSPRILDKRLQLLVDLLFNYSSQKPTRANFIPCFDDYSRDMVSDRWRSTIMANTKLLHKCLLLLSSSHEMNEIKTKDTNELYHKFEGFTDFSHTSDLENLLNITSMQALSKQLARLGIPASLNKYGITAILHSDNRSLTKVYEMEKKHEAERSYQDEDKAKDQKSHLNGTSHNDKLLTVDLQPLIYELKFLPSSLRLQSTVRASICAALFFFGSPVEMDKFKSRQLNAKLKDISYPKSNSMDLDVFNIEQFLRSASILAGTDLLLDKDEAKRYMQQILIPHCIRLCLRWCQTEEDMSNLTKFGKIAAGFKNNMFLSLKSILPDPLMSGNNHLQESLPFASAILRRVRLTRSIRCVVGDGVQFHTLDSFLRSPKVRSDMKDMPIWWCPWIHDVALMVHVARFGLFSIVDDIKNDAKLRQLGSVFEYENIKNLVTEILLDGINEHKPLIPKHVLGKLDQNELDEIIEHHSNQFPSSKVIESRLSYICGQLTRNGSIPEDKNNANCKYFDLPLFDHFQIII